MPLLPFLSLAIPTWNRCHYLEKNIRDIISQIKFFNLTNVEIVVSDNASDDQTQSICQELSKQFTFITYLRHANNQGANANFEAVMRASHGEYIWLLGDDDLIAKDILKKIIDDLHVYSPTLAIGGAIDEETQTKITHTHVENYLMTDFLILKKMNLIELAGKISGLVFKRAELMPILDQAQLLIQRTKTPWPHLAWFVLLMDLSNTRLLLLPYGLNQLLTNHWQNLIFTGEQLIQIHFVAQQQLILELKTKINKNFYNILINQLVTGRILILIKCVVYASYLDAYFKPLLLSMRFFLLLKGAKNKFYFFLFLIFPLCFPAFLRRFLIEMSVRIFPIKKLKKISLNLKKIKNYLKAQPVKERAHFNKEQL